MFHPAAVPVSLLEVLTNLKEALADSGFALAEGSSLALRLAHKLSTDLDFFSTEPFDPAALASHLGIDPEAILGQASGTLQILKNQVKVEFLRHSYPRLFEDAIVEGVRM